MGDLRESVINGIVEMMREAAFNVPKDVKEALIRAYEVEDNPVAKANLDAILKNIEASGRLKIPMCQDTGTPTFFIELGDDFPMRSEVRSVIEEAVRRATAEIPLRPNTVNPWTGENPGDNTGRYVPIVHVELVPGDRMRVMFLAKGGGSENTSKVYMLSPVLGVKGIKRAVIDAMVDAGPQPCPPIIVGVGVGGSADLAIKLAKKATFRRLNEPNPDPKLAELEKELLEMINSLGLGPMGL
ncbi:MAG: fumarate hydratase, partial [Candidatus Korarchaeum sp.]